MNENNLGQHSIKGIKFCTIPCVKYSAKYNNSNKTLNSFNTLYTSQLLELI
jgi:hypothetical protein